MTPPVSQDPTPRESSSRRIVPTAEVDNDPHQVALWRLAAVAQYLYDTMAGDADSDRPEPMPQMAMECVREAQRQLDLAIKHGQRTRRSCIGGELDLCERWKSNTLTFPEWAARQTHSTLRLHEEGRRVRGRLDEGGDVPLTAAEHEALAVYDRQQAGG